MVSENGDYQVLGNQRDKRMNNLLLAGGSLVLGLQVVFDLWLWHAFSALGYPEIDMGNLLLASAACIGVAWLAARLTFARLETMQDSKLDRFYELLRHDALTGALNRTFFLDRIRSDAVSGTLLAIDVDYFKKVNDRYGHYTGDAALAHLAAVMPNQLGDTGYVGRLGGEEFAVFLPSYELEAGAAEADKLRQSIEAATLEIDGAALRLTVSIGAAFHDNAVPIGQTLKLADDRLYAAKKLGRNCVASQPNAVVTMREKLTQAQLKIANSA